MSRDVQVRQPGGVVAELQDLAPQIAQLGVEPARFARIVVNQLEENSQLAECTVDSLVGAVMMSAQLDLEPGKALGLSWLIPRRRKGGPLECTWMLGYKGIIELARRAGIVIRADKVCRGDEFRVTAGSRPDVHHVYPADPNDRGDSYAWYAIADMPDGRRIHRVLNRKEVLARRKIGDPKGNSSAWNDHFDAMAIKSAIRALQSQLPLSAHIQAALSADDEVLHLPQPQGQVDVEVVRDRPAAGQVAAGAPAGGITDQQARAIQRMAGATDISGLLAEHDADGIADLTEAQAAEVIAALNAARED